MMEQLRKALYMHGWVKFSQTPELYSLLASRIMLSHCCNIGNSHEGSQFTEKNLELMPALREVASCKKS